jgi:hypothetical protein
LPALPPTSLRRHISNAPAAPEQPGKLEIPAWRALVRYGMTISHVADLYRLPVEAIERVRRKT